MNDCMIDKNTLLEGINANFKGIFTNSVMMGSNSLTLEQKAVYLNIVCTNIVCKSKIYLF